MDKHADLSLSNGDLTVTDTGSAGQKAVRAIQSFSTGKLYWEWSVDSMPGSNKHCVGWCDSVHPLNYQPGRTTTGNGWGYHGLGRLYHNNSYDSITAFSEGDIIMFAIDIDAGKLWVGVNGVWEGGGDPGAGTGETRDDIDVTPLFPAAGTVDNTHVGTANFGGSAFQYTIPDGFFPAC